VLEPAGMNISISPDAGLAQRQPAVKARKAG